jgi:aconitate decarboxylase
MTDSNSNKTTRVTKDLCKWIHTLQLDDIPRDVVVRAKHLILDGVGCAFIGTHLPWSETATHAVLSMESEGRCSIWGWDKVCYYSIYFSSA